MSYSKTNQINVQFTLPPGMLIDLKKIATSRNVTVNEMVCALMEIYLKDPVYRKEVNTFTKPKVKEFRGFIL